MDNDYICAVLERNISTFIEELKCIFMVSVKKSAGRNSFSYRQMVTFALLVALTINIFYVVLFFVGKGSMDEPRITPGQYLNWNGTLILYNFFSAFIYTLIMEILDFYLVRRAGSRAKQIILLAGINVLVTFFLSFILMDIHIAFFGEPEFPGRFFVGNLIKYATISIITLFITLIYYISYREQQMALDYERLSNENIKTRYEALKNQTDPHFLFNSLGTLKSLIRTDPGKAEDYVQKFSVVFRYTLQEKDLIPLKDEIDFTKAYGDLMLIRYGENLRFDIRIDEKYDQYPIIPISVQTLVENAIKHNVISEKYPLTIQIHTTDDNCICVTNPIQPKKVKESGSGIGLRNLAERYRLMFHETIRVRRSENLYTVIIPLIHESSYYRR